MKALLAFVVALNLCLLVSCDPPPKTQHERKFALETDSRLHCPKCGASPATMNYHPENTDSMDADGGGPGEHFATQCGGCGFYGWASIQDGNFARRAINR